MKDFSKLCTPAQIYFAIAVIATIIALLNGSCIMYEFRKIIFAFIWTFILGWVCDKGYTSISWFLVFLPYILIFLLMLNIYHVTQEQSQLMRAIGLQGAYGKESVTNMCDTKGGNKKKKTKKWELVRADSRPNPKCRHIAIGWLCPTKR